MSASKQRIEYIASMADTFVSLWNKGTTIRQMASSLGIGRASISKSLIASGIDINSSVSRSKRMSKININLKDISNETPEACYWLGFILADGSIYKNYLEVSLSNKDIGHLEKLRDFIAPEATIRYREDTNACRLSIGSVKLVELLESKGISRRKSTESYNLYVPKHEEHFIRGYIDGDGSFGLLPKESVIHMYFNVIGHIEILKLIQKYFGFSSGLSRDSRSKCDKTMVLKNTIVNPHRLIKLYSSGISLDRKYKRVKHVCRLLEKSGRLLSGKNGEILRKCLTCNTNLWIQPNSRKRFCSVSCNKKWYYRQVLGQYRAKGRE